jgi:putative phosphoesterase
MTLLILSDIHGNWPALKAVLAAEPQHSAVAFCGDVVDYGPQPVECLRWVSQNADYVVRGNHDNALGLGASCHCLEAFREYSVATREWHRTLLNESHCESLRQMPRLHSFEWEGQQFLMAHATPFRIAHATPHNDLFEYRDMDQWGERITGLDTDFVLVGHTHIQGARTFGRITVVNPGSVGLARDHLGKACYAVYREGQIELKQIPYEVGRTAALLRAAPLPSRVIDGMIRALGYEDYVNVDRCPVPRDVR